MKKKIEVQQEPVQSPTPDIATHATCFALGCKIKSKDSLASQNLADQMWFCSKHKQEEGKKW